MYFVCHVSVARQRDTSTAQQLQDQVSDLQGALSAHKTAEARWSNDDSDDDDDDDSHDDDDADDDDDEDSHDDDDDDDDDSDKV